MVVNKSRIPRRAFNRYGIKAPERTLGAGWALGV
jgi:hypothetical protein